MEHCESAKARSNAGLFIHVYGKEVIATSMRKVKGLTNRIAAVFLSGLLVVGAVPGTVLASESPEDLGQTAETAAADER